MIRHVVAWRLAAESDTDKARDAQRIVDALSPLRDIVPEVIALNVGANVAYPDQNWDIVLVADYADLAGLEAYQIHPQHQERAAVVRALVSERASVDFEV